MMKKTLLSFLTAGVIATSVLAPSSTYYERFSNYNPSRAVQTKTIENYVPDQKEILKKKILEENLETGKYTPEKTVEILEKGIKKGGELPRYIDINYLYCLIEKESSWNPKAKSKVGAKGLAQVMKSTWKYYNPKTPYSKVYDPETNVGTAVKILKGHEEYFSKYHPNWKNLKKEEKLKMHAAAYNAGQSKLKKINWEIDNKKKVPLETRKHIAKIMEKYKKLSG